MHPVFASIRRPLPQLGLHAITVAVLAALWALTPGHADSATPAAVASAPAAASAPVAAQSVVPLAPVVRSVTLVSPKFETWPEPIDADGDVMPWQEMRVYTEVGGLRLVRVLVNVGDTVKKGQVLAQLDTATVEAEMEAVNAQLMEAQASLAQAEATLDRAKRLAPSGGVSKQDLMQFETQKQTATARLNVAQVRVKTQQLKLDSAKLVAPDDGVISARAADEGDIVRSGNELFRLIRQGRLEWRAEVGGDTLLRLTPGLEVTIHSPLGHDIKGHVRQLSPTIDLKTHNGLAYVDLPADSNFKAGLHVSGTVTIRRKALVLPASAIEHDDAGDRVFTVTTDNKVQAVKVKIGRSQDDMLEITAGLTERSKVIAKDVAGLKAGELVNVMSNPDTQKLGQEKVEPGKS